jgi:hypothetical protein
VDSLRPPLPDWIPLDHPAHALLSRRQGKRRGRISYRPLDLDEYSPNIPTWESLLQVRLIGIGEFGHGYQLLFLASDGRCFSEDIVDGDVFYYEAKSLVQFHLMPLLGKRSRPMLRPDQDSVMAYGFTMTRESPEVYPYTGPSRNDQGS